MAIQVKGLAAGLLMLSAATVGSAQKIGPQAETNPSFPTKECTASGCTAKSTKLTLDARSRNFTSGGQPAPACNQYDQLKTVCQDAKSCAQTCEINGADYEAAGATISGNSVTVRLFAKDQTGADKGPKLLAPKLYVMADSGEKYQMMQLIGKELSVDVDVSQAPCGAVAAFILQEMDATGSQSDLNPAGAKYGTGYCNAQCDTHQPFVQGIANPDGQLGACCAEIDVFHGNSRATQASPHPCAKEGSFACHGDTECAHNSTGLLCDPHGCFIKPYQQGAKDFFGIGKTVDTRKPFTVITQFVGSSSGLTEMRRLWVQDGKLIKNFVAQDTTGPFSATPDYCSTKNPAMTNLANFTSMGGLNMVGGSLSRGMALSLGVWTDPTGFANWLDSGNAGPCSADEGDPAKFVKTNPDTKITYSDLRWGDIDTTYKDKITSGGSSSGGATTTTGAGTAPAKAGASAVWTSGVLSTVAAAALALSFLALA